MEGPGIGSSTTEARRSALAGGLLVAVVLAVHARALGAGFLWDDRDIALGWPAELARRGLVWTGPFTEQGGYYRPLISASYVLDGWLYGQSPAGFHLTNLLAHAVCALLVMTLARRLGASPNGAAACAGIWASLPRLTESVTWVSGRTDVLMTAFGLGAFLLWPRDPERPQWERRVASAALLGLALASKETGTAALFALLTLEWMGPGARARKISSTLGLVGVSALYWSARTRALAGYDADVKLDGVSGRALATLDALGSATLALLDPLHPSAILGAVGEPRALQMALGGLGACSIVALGVWAWRHDRSELLAIWALGTTALLAPLPWVPSPVNTAYADRFLYLPAAAGLACFVRAPRQWFSSNASGPVLLSVALALLAWKTNARITDYQDPARFWTRATTDTKGTSTIALRNLGAALQERLEPDDAELLYRRALALHAGGSDGFLDTVPVMHDLASVLALKGDAEGALELRLRLAQQGPTPDIWLDVARSAAVARRFDLADQALSQPGVLELPRARVVRGAQDELRRGAHRGLWDTPAAPGTLAEIHERARIADVLGWRSAAIASWLGVALHTDARLEDVVQACAVLCQIGSLGALDAGIERLSTSFPISTESSVLTTCRRDRTAAHRAALELRRQWAPFVPGADLR